jgi:hypothetical protein
MFDFIAMKSLSAMFGDVRRRSATFGDVRRRSATFGDVHLQSLCRGARASRLSLCRCLCLAMLVG